MAEARYTQFPTLTTPQPVLKRAQVKLKRPALICEMLEVSWDSKIDVAREKKKVVGPHWKLGEDVKEKNEPGHQKYAGGSTRPAYYLVKSKARHDIMVVKIDIKKSHNQEPYGMLTGTLGTLKFEGKCPTTVGVHFVGLVITNMPDVMAHYEGDASWNLTTSKTTAPLANTRLELFVGLDKPASFFKEGVWVEALRLLFKKVKVSGEKDFDRVAAIVTHYCHSRHGMRYAADGGVAQFGSSSMGGDFHFMKYLNWPEYRLKTPNIYGDQKNNLVNCYDQAAAVQSLNGAVGVKTSWVFYDPYGFINTTNVVGIGKTNSPFFWGKTAIAMPVVNKNDPKRTAFSNHAFLHVGDRTGKILDACAGPHLGTENLLEFLHNSIDLERSFTSSDFGGLLSEITGITPESGAHYCQLLIKKTFWKPDGVEELK